MIITGSDVKKEKPHPESYKKILRALKIKPSDAVVIENAPLGIESAMDLKIITNMNASVAHIIVWDIF